MSIGGNSHTSKREKGKKQRRTNSYRDQGYNSISYTSGKRAFGLDSLVPASIWAGTKGLATSPQNRNAAHEALVPARKEPLVPV
jgi:hypothetical protein